MADILRIDDFSGGETDFYRNGPPTAAKEMQNCLVTRVRKLQTRWGSQHFDSASAQTALGSVRVGKLFNYDWDQTIFMCQSNRLFRHDAVTGWQELHGNSAGEYAFPSSSTSNYYSGARWNNHIFFTSDDLHSPVRKVYLDNGGTWRMYQAGLPALSFPGGYPTFTASSAGAGHTYLYFFHLRRSYTLTGGVAFQDAGPVYLYPLPVTSTAPIDATHTVTIKPSSGAGPFVWPFPANTSGAVYDLPNLMIDIYRTIDAGTIGQLVGSVAYGSTAAFVDNVPDGSLGAEIYIAGDVLDYDPPPIAKYLTISNDVCWYGNVVESDGAKPYRVRQSIQFAPDKCPGSLYLDMDAEITGMASVGNTPLVFCVDRFYRLEGYVDNLGSGFTRKVIVSDTVGCISADSIIQSQRGVCFASQDGFYFTDGYSFTRVSDNKTKTYAALIQGGGVVAQDTRRKRITGAYDKLSDRYYWGCQLDINGTDNDSLLVLDANFGISKNSCFTTLNSGADFRPTALSFLQGDLLRGDNAGYVFRHSETLYTDLVIGSNASPALWTTKAVNYRYTSCAFPFGIESMKKYVTRMLASCNNETNLSLQISSCNDDQDRWSLLKEVRFRGNVLWGDLEVVWGDPSIVWNYAGVILADRRFPAGGLRCIYKQVRFENSLTVICRSDDYGLGTVAKGGKTVHLSPQSWPTDIENLAVYFEWDGYSEAFPIASRTSSTLTLTDTLAHLRDGNWKWEVKGFRKEERLVLDTCLLKYETFGAGINGWAPAEAGGNA